MRGGDFASTAIEIEPAFVKMADLDRIEAIDLPEEPVANGSTKEKKRMRRKTKEGIAAARTELAQIGKSTQVFDFVRLDIEQHDVRAFQAHLRCLEEENSHRGGVGEDLRPIEDLIVKGNGERAETELARALEQLMRSVIEMIFGIVERVDVEIDLDPIFLLLLLMILLQFHRDEPKCRFHTVLKEIEERKRGRKRLGARAGAGRSGRGGERELAAKGRLRENQTAFPLGW